MTPIIHIPKPCHENWNAMQSAQQGRHCNACCKTVIDFTTWPPGEIANYLADPMNKKTCGRFYKTQLQSEVPASVHEWTERIYQSSLSEVRKIAAVIIVVFSIMGTGCQKPTMGKAIEPLTQRNTGITVGEIQPIELIGDTVMIQPNGSLPVCNKGTIAEKGIMMGIPARTVENIKK